MSDSYRIFVRDLVLPMEIGIHDHERGHAQRVRLNLDVETLRDPDMPGIDGVVSYEDLINGIKDIIGRGHIDLVETLGDSVLEMVVEDPRVIEATICIEKLDVFGDTESVGAEMTRRRAD